MTQYDSKNPKRQNRRRPPTPVQRVKPQQQAAEIRQPNQTANRIQAPQSGPNSGGYQARSKTSNRPTLTQPPKPKPPPATPPKPQQRPTVTPLSHHRQTTTPQKQNRPNNSYSSDFDEDDIYEEELTYEFDEDSEYIEDDWPSVKVAAPKKKPQPKPTQRKTKPAVKRPSRPPQQQTYAVPQQQQHQYAEEQYYFEEEIEEEWDEYEEREPLINWGGLFSRRDIPMPEQPSMGLVLGTVGAIIFSLLLLGTWFLSSFFANIGTTSPTTNRVQVNNPNVIIASSGQLAPFFAPSVLYWEPQILHWSERHQLDPNMIATIMQIESCGDPGALSGSGAQGLFQVMPFHFQDGEDAFDPDTNALRGMNYFAERLLQTKGDIGRAFAGYNGGHVASAGGWNDWADETQRYFTWSTGIYGEALEGNQNSETLNQWLAAGGVNLCNQAEERLGMR